MTAATDLLPLPEPVAVKYPDSGLRDDEHALRLWAAHGYDTGGEPLFSAEQLREATAPLQAEVEALRAEVDEWKDAARCASEQQDSLFREARALNERADNLRAEVERLNAELSRLEVIAGYGGVSSDAPERLILASEVYDGVQSCDKWCDVRRVVDDGQPMPESATAYVRADRAERLAEALRLALDSHGKTLLTDPPQDAWKVNRVEEIGRAALRKQEEGNGQ